MPSRADLLNSAFFKYVYNPKGEGSPRKREEVGDDLIEGELNELNRKGVDLAQKFLEDFELDGTASAEGARRITPDERELVKTFLNDNYYGRFVEIDARPYMMQKFEIPSADVKPSPIEHRPKKETTLLALPKRVSKYAPGQLEKATVDQLPKAFADELERRKREFETIDGRAPRTDAETETLSAQVLGLLRDYFAALYTRGMRPGRGDRDAEAHEEITSARLLDAFETTRFGHVLGRKSYNGAPWGAAQSLALGMDPNTFETHFAKARRGADYTSLSMNGKMAPAMKLVDDYRESTGRDRRAEKVEVDPPLNFLIGEPDGHNKRGSLSEKEPFHTSGVNWGRVMFPGDEEIEKLPPKEGFEFPIDCLDGWSGFVGCNPYEGDKFAIRHSDGKTRVNMEKVIHNNAEGKPESWSAKFTNAATGAEIPPADVIGVFLDRSRRVKGDGKGTNSTNMWWWGFCDRNSAQQTYKTYYEIPQIDVDSVKVATRGGQTLAFPKERAQEIIDIDIPDIVTGETMCGFRFDDQPQRVTLKNGKSFEAQVSDAIWEAAPGLFKVENQEEDRVLLANDASRPLLGVIYIKRDNDEEYAYHVNDIASLTKNADGTVTMKWKTDERSDVTGTLSTDVPWDLAVERDGKRVLEQGATKPIHGVIEVTMRDGKVERIPADDIRSIQGEMQKEMSVAKYAAYVSAHRGVYATDASQGEVVSNGMRWCNFIDMDERTGDDKPEWAQSWDSQGPATRVPGDKVCYLRGLYMYEPNEDDQYTLFSGWIQVDKNGRILDETFTDGEPDFAWGARGPLNWKAQSSFNEFVPPELRLALLVNGVKALASDGPETEATAARLNLPANWRKLRTA